MGTPSTIAILKNDGTIHQSRCHWDGHIESNGKMLKENYTTVEKIEQLIELGYISSLDKECSKPDGHSFQNPVDGFTVAYHRDRGENLKRVKSEKFDNFKIFRLSANFEEYNYLYKDGKWLVMCGENRRNSWHEY